MSIENYKKALELVKEKHKGVFRKGSKEPYVEHVIRVSDMVFSYTQDINLAIAGLCHDLVEDTDIKTTDIENMFGKYVADIVESVTYRRDDRPDVETKGEYLAELLMKYSDDTRIVKLCDRLDNVNSLDLDIDDKQFKKFRRYYMQQTFQAMAIMNACSFEFENEIVIVIYNEIHDKLIHLRNKYYIGGYDNGN